MTTARALSTRSVAAVLLLVAGASFGCSVEAEGSPAEELEPLWAERSTSTGTSEFNSVAVASGGQAVVGGTFWDSIRLGTATLTSGGDLEGVVAALDGDGQLIWTATASGSGDDAVAEVVITTDDEIFVTGTFSGAGTLFGEPADAGTGTSAFLAKLHLDGSLAWIRLFGVDQFQSGVALAPDGEGGVYVGGDFVGTLELGSEIWSSAGMSDVFLARFDADGEPLWARVFGSIETETVQRVAVQERGVALLVRADAALDFGGGPVEGATPHHQILLVASFDPGGGHYWSTRVSQDRDHGIHASPNADANDEHATPDLTEDSRSLAVAADGSIHVALSVREGLQHAWETPNPPAIHIASFDENGRRRSSAALVGEVDSIQIDGGMARLPNGDIRLLGSFQGTLTLDTTELVHRSSRQLFFIDLEPDGATTHLATHGQDDLSFAALALASDAHGAVTAAGFWRPAGTSESHAYVARFAAR